MIKINIVLVFWNKMTSWNSSTVTFNETPSRQTFGAYWSQIGQLWWQQFLLLIFLRTNVIFCTKQAWYRTTGPIPRRAAPYEEFPPWGSRHHCPMEIGAYSSLCMTPQKVPLYIGEDPGPILYTVSWVHIPNDISICSVVLVELTLVANRQTDHATTVAISRTLCYALRWDVTML